jgi:hypothetical protein
LHLVKYATAGRKAAEKPPAAVAVGGCTATADGYTTARHFCRPVCKLPFKSSDNCSNGGDGEITAAAETAQCETSVKLI